MIRWKAEFGGCSSGIDLMSEREVGIVLSHDLTEIADLIWRLRRQALNGPEENLSHQRT
jgi:hypothetical protein